MSKQPKSPRPAGSAKHEMTKSPGKDDVHEQREPDQEKEGVVTKPVAEASAKKSQR